ncbi:oligosaccharide flippase family protein [Bacillus lacus]|uniref:Oligosaccharide flippase family protein n=1 Tax=Metabacillus lacus TaxID=1983721 RepID=A0A7X2IYK1_9BACI|nr:oligosaccharide flippase family protein [Metabacillus lacus]MRX72168.1 oligosaccharide flippase family protein [Metabacillus lacus]
MLNQLKRLGGDSLLYALMNVGTKLIAFLMIPIYTSYLGREQFGALGTIDSFTSMMTFLVIFGTDSALAYYYFDKDHKGNKIEYVRNVLLFRFYVALSLLILSVLFGPALSYAITGTRGFELVLQLSFIVLLLEALITLVLTYFRYEFLSKRVVIMTVLRLGLVALLSYAFLRFISPDVEMVIYGRMAAALAIIVFLLPQLKRFAAFKFNGKLMKELLTYAAPLVPASMAFWVISQSNKLFITHFEGLESVGLYEAALRFATVITLLTSSVQMAWRPYSMSIKDKPNAKSIFRNVYVLIFAVGMFGLMGVATFVPFIFEAFLGEDFHEASMYIPLLSLGTFLNFYYLIISVGLFIEKKTKPISFYFGIAAVISVILNLILIPLFSLWGAAAAVTVAYGFACVSIFLRSQKEYYVPTPVGSIMFMFVTGLLSIAAVQYVLQFSELSIWYVLIPWLFFALTNGGVLATLRRKGRVEETA